MEQRRANEAAKRAGRSMLFSESLGYVGSNESLTECFRRVLLAA